MVFRLALALLSATVVLSAACVDRDRVELGQHAITELDQSLRGRADPIATWLRAQSVRGDGNVIHADMPALLLGLAVQAGCEGDDVQSLSEASSIRTFVISDDLVPSPTRGGDGESSFPRLISTVCSQDARKARDVFVAASFKHPSTTDVDLRNLEMFAWDPGEKLYRFYKTTPLGDDAEGLVAVTVAPPECAGCHLTPRDLDSRHMPMLPIMNELRQPWTHWQSESLFSDSELSFAPPHGFDLPEAVADAEGFNSVVSASQGSAAGLELTIVSAQKRVVSARVLGRHQGQDLSSLAKLRRAMSLLRPVFCEEQLNYTSEEGESRFLRTSAIIDPGIRRLYRLALPPGLITWPWATVERFRLDAATGAPVDLIPVRGNANVLHERALAAARNNSAMSALDALRVRALDWDAPILSSFRCDLYRRAEKRFQRVKNRPAGLASASSVAAVTKLAFREIMKLRRGGRSPATLLLGAPDRILTVRSAAPDVVDRLHRAVADGTVGTGPLACDRDQFCLLTLAEWGDALQAKLEAVAADPGARRGLRQARCQRVKTLLSKFDNRPALPMAEIFPLGEIDCPEVPDGLSVFR